MQQFELTLKNDKVKSYHIIALINLVLTLSVFTFLLFYDAYRAVAMSSIVAMGFYLLLRWYVFKKQNARFFFDEFVFFIPAICFFGLNSYVFMILLIVMGILYKVSLLPAMFIFTDKNIVKANFPKKEFSWNAFSNVILKDNILTLDLKSNKLIQAEIEKPQSLVEKEFNDFASLQINKSVS